MKLTSLVCVALAIGSATGAYSPRRAAPNRKPRQGKPAKPTKTATNKAFDYSNDVFGLKIDANGAQYQLRNVMEGNKGKKYSLKFLKLFQSTTSMPPFGNPLALVNLEGNYDWTISTPTEVSNADTWEVAFNMTSVAAAGTPAKPHPQIEFRNHVLANENNTVVKFDIAIDGMDNSWWASGATHMILAYRMRSQEPGKDADNALTRDAIRVTKGEKVKMPKKPTDGATVGEEEVTEDVVDFQGARLGSKSVAMQGGVAKTVVMSHGDEGGDQIIFVAYPKFDTMLVHDPSLELNGESSEVVFSAGAHAIPSLVALLSAMAGLAMLC